MQCGRFDRDYGHELQLPARGSPHEVVVRLCRHALLLALVHYLTITARLDVPVATASHHRDDRAPFADSVTGASSRRRAAAQPGPYHRPGTMRLAALDVGSNSVHLAVADVD